MSQVNAAQNHHPTTEPKTFLPAQGPASKALGGPAGSPAHELQAWYAQAYGYYQEVQSGSQAMPDAAAWEEFILQMNWAYEQIQGPDASWMDGGEVIPWEPDNPPFGSSQGYPPSDPFGGLMGPQGHWIHNTEAATLGLVGGQTREVWSNDIQLQIPSLSARVEAVIIQDSSTQPPEEILKIIITDPATGQQDTILVHDYEDANIQVNIPTAEQVQDASGRLEWKKYQGPGSDDFSQEVNVPVETMEDGSHLVEAPMGETIDFTPAWDVDDVDPEQWELWGDFNLNLRPSDRVHVMEGAPGDPDGFTIKITRRNGKVITLHTHEGFKGNLNANPENIIWGGPVANSDFQSEIPIDGGVVDELAPEDFPTPRPDQEGPSGVPAAFADHFTLNGESFEEMEEDMDIQGDFPTKTDGETRTWDGVDFDIYTRGDGKTNDIFARGKVTLHPSSNMEYWTVNWDAGRKAYRIEIFGDAERSELQEVFYVDQMVDELILDVDPSHLEFEEPLGMEFDPSSLDTSHEHADKISILGEDKNKAPSDVEWPSLAIQGAIKDIDGETYAQKLEIFFAAAIKTGDWVSAKTYLMELRGNPEKANDAIRVFMDALYTAVGGDEKAMDEVMDLIPEDVRLDMINAVTAKQGELDEKRGARWNSATTAAKILATLDGPQEDKDKA